MPLFAFAQVGEGAGAPPSTIVFVTSSTDLAAEYQYLRSFQERWKQREPLASILHYSLSPFTFPLTQEGKELSVAVIAERLRGKSPTLIVSQGDPALLLSLELRDARFPETPIIAVDVIGGNDRRKQFENDELLYAIEISDVGPKNFELATRLFPKRKRAVLLLSVGKNMELAERIHSKYVTLFPDLTIVTVPNPTQDSADPYLRESPEDTFVIGFNPGWIDSSGRYRSGKDYIRSIMDTYKVPMFEHLRSNADGGTVGGVGLSPTRWGTEAAERGLALIFEGKGGEHWTGSGRIATAFADYRELKRFGSTPELLPPGAELINAPPSPWIRYQRGIQALLAALLLALVGFIVRTIVKHREKLLLVAANEHLEREVADRTRRLSISNEELEKTNESLTQAIRRTEEMQERVLRSAREITLGRFTAGIANGLNSPLNAIRSAASALKSLSEGGGTAFSTRLLALDESQRTLFLRHADRILSRIEFAGEMGEVATEELERRLARLACGDPSSVASDLADAGLAGLADAELEPFAAAAGAQVAEALYLLSVIVRSTWIIDVSVDRAVEAIKAIREYVASTAVENPDHTADIRVTIERALSLFKNRFPPSVMLRTEYEEVPKIRGDESSLVRIWAHLIQNALQAMPSGGALEIRLRTEGRYAVVTVEDEGAGIDPAVADKVFEPFVTTRPMAEGMGLGLAFCKRAIDALGGEIDFIDKEKGTILRVRLPLEESA